MGAAPASVEWRAWSQEEDDIFRPNDMILTIRCPHGESKTYHTQELLHDGLLSQRMLTRMRLDVIRGQHWCGDLQQLYNRYVRAAAG